MTAAAAAGTATSPGRQDTAGSRNTLKARLTAKRPRRAVAARNALIGHTPDLAALFAGELGYKEEWGGMSEQGWHFDSDGKFSEGNARPQPGGYTAEEFDSQWRPDCPNCGGSIEVQRVDCRDHSGRTLYIPGRLRCLGSCSS